MRTVRSEPSSEYLLPLAIGLLIPIALAFGAFLVGAWLFQPTVVPNRGMAAYEAPVGTRLIPLPHKMDAPELAQITPAAVEPEPAEPAPVVAEQKPVAPKPKVAHKRAKARPQRDQYNPGNVYADRWGNAWGGRGGWDGGWRGGWTTYR